MRGFESAWLSTAADVVWAEQQVPYDCPYPVDLHQRYILRDLIAIGPRSWVYLASDQKFSTEKFVAKVVVKISRAADGREADLGRQIEHPDIPATLDRGVTQLGHAYVVLEWVDGQGLDRVAIPWEMRRGVRFVTRLSRIIEAAHARGIVHCDLKPDNVRVGEDERPVLLDFDLAASTSDRSTTQSRGNLGFMAPEQYRGGFDAITPQADVYGLGGLLIFLLTGAPTNGSNPEQAQENLRDAKAWTGHVADTDLQAIIRRAVAPRQSDRYSSVSALAADLERWSARLPIEWLKTSTVRRASLWARRRPMVALCNALAVLLILGGVVYAFAWSRLKANLEMEALRRETQREAEALREVNARTQAELERLRNIGRNQLRTFAFSTFAKPADGQGEQYLPMLAWLSNISKQTFFVGEGPPPLLRERIEAVRRVEDRAISLNQHDSFTLLLARLTLTELLIRDDRPQEAKELLARVVPQWNTRLAKGEPLHAIMHALDASAKLRLGETLDPGDLQNLHQQLEVTDAPSTYQQLLTDSIDPPFNRR